jgi:hypothetical protein
MGNPPSREAILSELAYVSSELQAKPLTGELIELREEADKLLDLYLDLGLQSTRRLVVPPRGYESENEWGE